jgi:hypothetical protein
LPALASKFVIFYCVCRDGADATPIAVMTRGLLAGGRRGRQPEPVDSRELMVRDSDREHTNLMKELITSV